MLKINAYEGQDIQYPIYIGDEIIEFKEKLEEVIPNHSSVVIFSDFFLEKLDSHKKFISLFKQLTSQFGVDLHLYPMSPGKDAKNIKTLMKISDWLIFNLIQRDTLFVAIGGGVVGDLVGFLASTYYRGVALIHVPTNVIAMSDSSIGGKTAINTNKHVNTLGTYKHPIMTLMYSEYLSTLTKREFYAGFAEIIKISILKQGPLKVKILENKSGQDLLQKKDDFLEILNLAIKYKIEFTNKDIRERSKRLFLNFGHTFGHAIESNQDLSTEEYYRHGEAVSLGMVSALYLSDKLFKSNITQEYLEILENFHLPIKLSKNYLRLVKYKNKQDLLNNLISIAFSDKKGAKGELRLILIKNNKPIIYPTSDKNLLRYGFEKIL